MPCTHACYSYHATKCNSWPRLHQNFNTLSLLDFGDISGLIYFDFDDRYYAECIIDGMSRSAYLLPLPIYEKMFIAALFSADISFCRACSLSPYLCAPFPSFDAVRLFSHIAYIDAFQALF